MTRTSLPEELHLEILKRMLPTPQVLARASAVCREWRLIVNDPTFLHELYRKRHGAPVTLGFFNNFNSLPRSFVHVDAADPVRFAFDSIDHKTNWQFLDCRHGRVLLRDEWGRFVVWHPMTGDHHILRHIGPYGIEHASVALICECDMDSGGDDQCTPCHASHFRVAVVLKNYPLGLLHGAVFSSLTGLWTIWEKLALSCQICPGQFFIVGKTLYQLLSNYFVLAFDMDQLSLTIFKRPMCDNVRLLQVDGGTLAVAGVFGSTLRLWVRRSDSWVVRKSIDLREILTDMLTPSSKTDRNYDFLLTVKIIGVADGGDELFLWTTNGIFMLCVESMELKKVHDTTHNMTIVNPYAAYYLTPAARTQRLQLRSTILA